jgi:hypothetical protein
MWQEIVDMHLKTEKNLKAAVLPIFEQLHTEIKRKAKVLQTGSTKGLKQVEKTRSSTQRQIEALGQYSALWGTSGKVKMEPAHDPYILCQGIYYHLNKQITEENNSLQDILVVQNSFQQFETHILKTLQNGLNQFFQCMSAQTDHQHAMYADMVSAAQQIPTDFEWANFCERNDASLINPNTLPRILDNITVPNQDHPATKPLIEGHLDRKSHTPMKGYSSGYYVVTPAGYLHGFKDMEDLHHDPSPDLSLYLPDCFVGPMEGLEFHVKGKDVSSCKVRSAFGMLTELHFKAHSKPDADKWFAVMTSVVGRSLPQPSSPIVSRNVSGTHNPNPVVAMDTSSPTSPTKQQDEDAATSPQTEETIATSPAKE